MAVTKIWAITDSVSRVLSYAANPDKTIYSDIYKALHYAGDEQKTVVGEEKAMYVTGVNCSAETAFAKMNAVQERFDKTTGNVLLTTPTKVLRQARLHPGLLTN